MLRRNADKLSAQAALEAAAVADFAAFEAYFRQFLGAVPWIIRRRKLPAVVFRIRDSSGLRHWLIDPKRREVSVLGAVPPGVVQFEVHALVVNDCAKHKMFSVWTASKRLKIHLPSAVALKQADLVHAARFV
jgi:hypothetical protein